MSAPQQPNSTTPGVATPPSELEGLMLPQRSPEPTGSLSAKEPTSPTVQPESQQILPFVSLTHSYLWSAVTFADQKAAFMFASDSAFLGYLLSDGLLRHLKSPFLAWLLPQWLALASLAFLGTSIGIAIWVVMPRLGGRTKGMIYFRAIAARENSGQYVAEVMSSADSSLSSALAEHSYELARISTRKYKHLQVGMWVGVLGFVAGLAYVGLTR